MHIVVKIQRVTVFIDRTVRTDFSSLLKDMILAVFVLRSERNLYESVLYVNTINIVLDEIFM